LARRRIAAETDALPGPFSIAAVRAALLQGSEPPPARAIERLTSYGWFVVGTVCLGSCMGQIDASMTQVLLPRLERDFAAPLANVSWVAVSYLLTMASFTPIFGRLADMFGRKLLYMGGFLTFITGSGLCGFAPNLETLIACRVAQAIGAALVTSNSTAITLRRLAPRSAAAALACNRLPRQSASAPDRPSAACFWTRSAGDGPFGSTSRSG
jgi:MFS transporter